MWDTWIYQLESVVAPYARVSARLVPLNICGKYLSPVAAIPDVCAHTGDGSNNRRIKTNRIQLRNTKALANFKIKVHTRTNTEQCMMWISKNRTRKKPLWQKKKKKIVKKNSSFVRQDNTATRIVGRISLLDKIIHDAARRCLPPISAVIQQWLRVVVVGGVSLPFCVRFVFRPPERKIKTKQIYIDNKN